MIDRTSFEVSTPSDFPPRVSAKTKIALVLGILSVPTGFIGVGVLLGLIALVLGLLGLREINKYPGSFAGKGFALTGIITGAVGFLFVAPVGAYGYVYFKERSNRVVCARNINEIVKSMVMYSFQNSETFPAPPRGTSSPGYEDVHYDPHTAAGNNNSLACVGILVSDGSLQPEYLICPSDPFSAGAPASRVSAGTITLNTNQNSYSIAVPWSEGSLSSSTGPWWKGRLNSIQPVMADMVLAGSSRRPGMNSANHNSEGQNVGFGDGHVEFMTNSKDVYGCDISANAPNPIPTNPPPIINYILQPYSVWMTPHRTSTGAIVSP